MDCTSFAMKWERGRNGHDLDEILRHDRDDVVFRSREAVPLIGQGEIRGSPRCGHTGARRSGVSPTSP